MTTMMKIPNAPRLGKIFQMKTLSIFPLVFQGSLDICALCFDDTKKVVKAEAKTADLKCENDWRPKKPYCDEDDSDEADDDEDEDDEEDEEDANAVDDDDYNEDDWSEEEADE